MSALDLDDIHAAWLAGWDRGYAAGRQAASEDLAREWLHEDARRWTDHAVRLAAEKGPTWAAMIREQAAS